MTQVKLFSGELGLLGDVVQVIPGKLYFWTTQLPPRYIPGMHCFSTDTSFVYQPFFLDFGPLNLSCIYRYCKLIESKLQNPALQNKVLVHYSEFSPEKTTNAVLLLGSFLVAARGYAPEEAMQLFAPLKNCLKPFRDATYSGCEFRLLVLDCLRGLSYAMQMGWFDLATFDQETYDHYERLENGDMNWIIPGKFLAFSCPSIGAAALNSRRNGGKEGPCSPAYYVRVFKKLKVKLVIRLNKKMYDAKIFKDAGIQHHDLFFLDGTCPPRDIIQKFLHLCESCDGPVAVHCKAGLGRTGSLIGCYAIKNYKFPALPWIGWNRICRPGSVLGPQQYFLCDIQEELMKMDAIPSCVPLLRKGSSKGVGDDAEADKLAHSFKHMGLEDKKIAEYGDEGQGGRLMEAKRRSKLSKTNTKGDDSSCQVASSIPERTTTGGSIPGLRRASASTSVPDEGTSAPCLDLMLRSKYVGHLIAPIAAIESAGRKTAGNSCDMPAAGSPSGMYVTSTSRPTTSRSRNDV